MNARILALLAGVALVLFQGGAAPAYADNPMGYRLLSAQDTAGLPANHGALGLNVERARQITDDGMTFDIMRVTEVRRGSPGAQAGFKRGDQIIAVDGRVFPSIKAFAAYVGSIQPGSQITIDYMPAGSGPQQAQRVTATIAGAGQSSQASTGMSTKEKVAIGVGAAALLGCYEMGCFSHRANPQAQGGQQMQNGQQPSYGTQPP